MARRLQTIGDVRRYVASLINRVEDGTLNHIIAGRLCYMANNLKSIIEGSDIEKRVEELEERLRKEKSG